MIRPLRASPRSVIPYNVNTDYATALHTSQPLPDGDLRTLHRAAHSRHVALDYFRLLVGDDPGISEYSVPPCRPAELQPPLAGDEHREPRSGRPCPAAGPDIDENRNTSRKKNSGHRRNAPAGTH